MDVVHLEEGGGRRCTLHCDEKYNKEPVKSFNDETFAKAAQAVTARKSKQNFEKSKYFNICKNFPAHYDNTVGYHSSCHKNFTAVQGAVPSTSTTCESKTTRAKAEIIPISSSGVFKKQCLFCPVKQKGSSHEEVIPCESPYVAKEIKDAVLVKEDEDLFRNINGVDFHA